MRNLKFRAWDKKNKFMLDGLPIAVGTVYSISNNIRDLYVPGESENEDFALMESTGVFDKNGELIYEGDVLDGTESRYQVEWYEPRACLLARSWRGDGVMFDELEPVEVVGDIYANPELMKP